MIVTIKLVKQIMNLRKVSKDTNMPLKKKKYLSYKITLQLLK